MFFADSLSLYTCVPIPLSWLLPHPSMWVDLPVLSQSPSFICSFTYTDTFCFHFLLLHWPISIGYSSSNQSNNVECEHACAMVPKDKEPHDHYPPLPPPKHRAHSTAEQNTHTHTHTQKIQQIRKEAQMHVLHKHMHLIVKKEKRRKMLTFRAKWQGISDVRPDWKYSTHTRMFLPLHVLHKQTPYIFFLKKREKEICWISEQNDESFWHAAWSNNTHNIHQNVTDM